MTGKVNKAEVIQTIRDVGIVPVVRAQSADEVMLAIDAIREGGISILEITMTVPGAVGVIEEVLLKTNERIFHVCKYAITKKGTL